MTYIIYDEDKVLIGFENSYGELEYSIYTAEDGGVIETNDVSQAFEDLAESEEFNTDNDTMCIIDLPKVLP